MTGKAISSATNAKACAVSDVRAECRRHVGSLFDEPCIKIMAADMKTVREIFNCVIWCPLLNRRIEDDEREA